MIHKDTNEILLMHVIYVLLRYLKVASVQYSTNTMYRKRLSSCQEPPLVEDQFSGALIDGCYRAIKFD